ncbi:hypothetical protein [Rahnella selenatireducens]|uniref:hypothetical protein n=1 Tax=Rahnella selenatireducens TaxID=3389797 RepID=UPI003968B346
MNNSCKLSCACSLIILISLNSFASDSWTSREVNMQCGPATVTVSAKCKADPEDDESNICKSVTLNISRENKNFSANLPYIPLEQKRKLEKQKFTFPEIIDSSDWAPQKMFCVDEQYVLIGYWDGMNNAEGIDGSLSANSTAPIFDVDGNFVSQEKSLVLRSKIPPNPQGVTYINFVYGNN